MRSVSLEEVTIAHLPLTQIDHLFQLGDAVKHEEPALAQVVPLVGGQLEDLVDHLHVLVLQSFDVSELSKLGKGCDKGIPLRRHVEIATDLDGVGEPFNAERGSVLVIGLLK